MTTLYTEDFCYLVHQEVVYFCLRTVWNISDNCEVRYYEGESVNRSQLDMKSWNMWYSNLGKNPIYISIYFLHRHRYTCPIALPVRRNSQHRSLWAVVSAQPHISVSSSAISEHPWEFLDRAVKRFRRQEIFICEYHLHWVLLPTKIDNRALLCGSIPFKHGRQIDYWN
jgi:hypothetical protein